MALILKSMALTIKSSVKHFHRKKVLEDLMVISFYVTIDSLKKTGKHDF